MNGIVFSISNRFLIVFGASVTSKINNIYYENNILLLLGKFHISSLLNAILVPGGFGERGSEGKIRAIQFAREHAIPYFGICFGMQMAVLETARNLADMPDAGSSEFGDTKLPLVGLMTEWTVGNETLQRSADDDLGGTMRLGAYECHLTPGSTAGRLYGEQVIFERHRHRYEVNIAYRGQLEAAGMVISGLSPDGSLPEIVERADHPFFVAVQFHPEFNSRPGYPEHVFKAFTTAANQN